MQYKKYIRCHIVEALPMTRGSFNALRGKETPANENPDDEGYHVFYPDGYQSWCPKAQFEAAGRPIDGMTFGQAIEAMKQGKKVARRGWNGKDQFAYYVPADRYVAMTQAAKSIADGDGRVSYRAYLALRTAQGDAATWVPSVSDCLAEDWEIVE